LILSETNIKQIEFVRDTAGIIKKKIKPNFKALGPKVGKDMKAVSAAILELSAIEIDRLEKEGQIQLTSLPYTITTSEVEIVAEDLEGWQVANLGKLTVALDIQLTDELRNEGIARELINRIQNLRKDSGLDVTDKIEVKIQDHIMIKAAIDENRTYIQAEILADTLSLDPNVTEGDTIQLNDQDLIIRIVKL